MTRTMTHTIVADDVPPQRWRNGGGQTRELLADGDGGRDGGSDGGSDGDHDHWRWRLSLADIAADGPFSAFPGVQRWFAVVAGGGVALAFADRSVTLRRGDAPLLFDGAAAPGCRLLAGPTRDLNLMLRGTQGAMRFGTRFDEAWPLRGRFDNATCTLHWGLPAGPLHAEQPALWIGIAA